MLAVGSLVLMGCIACDTESHNAAPPHVPARYQPTPCAANASCAAIEGKLKSLFGDSLQISVSRNLGSREPAHEEDIVDEPHEMTITTVIAADAPDGDTLSVRQETSDDRGQHSWAATTITTASLVTATYSIRPLRNTDLNGLPRINDLDSLDGLEVPALYISDIEGAVVRRTCDPALWPHTPTAAMAAPTTALVIPFEQASFPNIDAGAIRALISGATAPAAVSTEGADELLAALSAAADRSRAAVGALAPPAPSAAAAASAQASAPSPPTRVRLQRKVEAKHGTGSLE